MVGLTCGQDVGEARLVLQPQGVARSTGQRTVLRSRRRRVCRHTPGAVDRPAARGEFRLSRGGQEGPGELDVRGVGVHLADGSHHLSTGHSLALRTLALAHRYVYPYNTTHVKVS